MKAINKSNLFKAAHKYAAKMSKGTYRQRFAIALKKCWISERFVELLDATIQRETDKAYFVDCTIDTVNGLSAKSIWFPKSYTKIINGAVTVAGWLFTKKNQEICNSFVYGITAA